jgi:SAM-dependent methyltransferase
MPCAVDASYDVVIANYVLEHVQDVAAALAEIARVLKPGGLFIATVPNPRAPEFRVARATPMWFHRLFQPGATPTHYSFSSVSSLIDTSRECGLITTRCTYSPMIGVYLEPLPRPIGAFGRLLEALALACRVPGLLGGVRLTMVRQSC